MASAVMTSTLFLMLWATNLRALQGREADLNCRSTQKSVRLVNRLNDSSFACSSHYGQFNASRSKILLDVDQTDEAWCPNVALRQNELNEWIMVTLPSLTILNNLLTAPRQHKTADSGEFSKQLFIQYKRTEAEEFRNYTLRSIVDGQLKTQSKIKGNTDVKDKRNYVTLKPPLVAKQIRIFPINPDQQDANVCLKFELFGCPHYQGLISYTAPQGHFADRGRGDFSDHYYDGTVQQGILTGGLGQLADYITSTVSPSTDPTDEGMAGLPYVGWDKRRLGSDTVELVFEFDAVRSFRMVTIDANNDFAKWDTRLFARASVSASIGGRHFPGTYETTVLRDDANQFTRPVQIQLGGLVGRFVRVRLQFDPDSNWMLLAEFFFESDLVPDPPPPETRPTPLPPPPVKGGGEGSGGGSSGPTPARPPLQPPLQPSAPTAGRGSGSGSGSGGGSHNERIERGGGNSGASETTTYVAIIVSILLGAMLLMLAIAFLCLRRRLLRKKQRASHQVPQSQIKQVENIHLDFSSGRPAMLVNGKLTNGSIYTSLPNSEDEEDRTELNGDPYTYAPAASFAPFVPGPAGAREYASATLYGPQQPQQQHQQQSQQPPPYGLYSTGLGTYARPKLITQPTGPLHHFRHGATADPRQQQQQRPGLPGLPPPSATLPPPPPPVPRFPSDLSIQGCSGNTVYACPDALMQPLDGGGPEASNQDQLSQLEVTPGSVSLKERLGGGQFGEVLLAEWSPRGSCGQRLVVAAKTLRPGASPQAREDFRREMRLLSRLQDPNIVRVLGVVTRDAQQCILVEYMQHGDLHQFLRDRFSPASMETEPPLSHGCLIYMAAQIASGMKYLEAMQLVHRDLACRNCLLGAGFQVKICDFGMSQPLYSADYCRLEGGRTALPIRWMAWEAVLHGRFSSRSDVWSFAVTLWEMLTYCREQPFAHLTDQQVVANCQHILLCNGAAQALPCPPLCPRELYDLLCECWQRDEACRPQFREIHLFLQRHNVGFSPQDGSILLQTD